MSPSDRSPPAEFTLAPFSYDEAAALMRELGLPEPVAVALVRRGHRTAEQARAFLAAEETHDPSLFGGMGEAVAVIRDAISRGELITVHGDYDVDGVTSTAIMVSTLRELGAECDWLIPARAEDGYGLTAATVERLAERGTGLVVTVDCGITSVAEVAAARARGIAAVVTDHHQPGEELPDCPIVHPIVSGYPYEHLCAAGVAHKLAAALAGPERAERDLDLVALATVADMVPLTGENRSLVRRGLEQARRGARPGLRALMAVAQVVPERLDEGALGFRLAPRINAAGRLYRADGAVELFLTRDDERAARIAAELDRSNQERRQTEAEVLAAAERALTELGTRGEEAPAIVLWGEDWHPGVVGICASRLAERRLKPTVLIALDGSRGRGSGRSVPGFDLLAGLGACKETLARYGGHRAAAGLEIERERLDEFRDLFWAHAKDVIDPRSAMGLETVDAVVGGESLGHDVATALERLGPFGKGNPEIRLLVPAARIGDVRAMGEGERHARFSLASGPARASGVAFGVGTSLAGVAENGPLDVSLRLELDEWNGAVSPRIVLGSLYPSPAGGGADLHCPDEEHAGRLAAALERDPVLDEASVAFTHARVRVDRTRASATASVAALTSSGEPVLVVCADAVWRRGLVESAASPARFGGGRSAVIASRGSVESGLAASARLLEEGRGGIALVDWPVLALHPELAAEFPHVVLADPAPEPRVEAVALAAARRAAGHAHVLSSHEDPALSLRALELSFPSRAALGPVYRELRDRAARPLGLEAVRGAVEAGGAEVRSPEWCGRAIRILAEIGVVRLAGSRAAPMLEVVSSVRGELERSPSFAANQKAHEECVRFLTRGKEQSSIPMPAAA